MEHSLIEQYKKCFAEGMVDVHHLPQVALNLPGNMRIKKAAVEYAVQRVMEELKVDSNATSNTEVCYESESELDEYGTLPEEAKAKKEGEKCNFGI